uniref:CH033 protein n=1 Tax=Pelusios castaneus TaxID=367368 RepID=A0A8C8R7H4_9SAUR
MEEAPQGTFQDELEWCILQLKTGLLCLNPTPEQAEETRNILKVLCSHKAPFVKKQQVVNHMFRDYQLKMAEEQKRAEKAGQRVERAAEDVSSDGLSSARPMEHATLLEANMPEVMGSVDGVLGRELPILETPKPESAPVDGVTAEKMAAAGAPRKKKKKKPSNIKKEVVETKVSKKEKVGTSGCEDTNEALQDKTMQHSDEQLWREVDWCVEQLELGLKTQKSTPKQAEEALRAIKTLRSDRAVLAKKRQIMRAMFGDYRKKMEEERQKQLKLMQAAAKSAQVMEVRENTRRKSSQVFRKRSGTSRKSLSPAGSPSHPPSHPDSPKALGTDSLVFSTSQEEFCFNFF